MQKIDTKKEFTLVKRTRSFAHAGRGLWVFLKTTPNVWIHIVIFLVAIVLGLYFQITRIEWIMIVFAGGLVLTAEGINTAIEIDIDLTSPEHHPYAKDTKDVAAGAVLISAITALTIGLIIFVPYLVILF